MTIPPRLGRSIRAVDLHAAGEPGRVIVAGIGGIPGRTMFEAMSWLAANRDDLRLRMLREPRGYPAANCNLVLPSSNPEADAGYAGALPARLQGRLETGLETGREDPGGEERAR